MNSLPTYSVFITMYRSAVLWRAQKLKRLVSLVARRSMPLPLMLQKPVPRTGTGLWDRAHSSTAAGPHTGC